MSIQALSWSIKQKTKNTTSKLVLLILANYANEKHESYPSEKHLGELVGVSERTIRRCLKQLTELGLITVMQRAGTSNLYKVNLGTDTSVLPVRTPMTSNTKENTKEIDISSVDKYDSDFTDFWKMYPRRINKHLAHKKWLVETKNFPRKKMIVCTIRFAEEVKNNKTEEKFIPHPSTWLNQKRYLDYENEKPKKLRSLNNIAG